MNFRSISLSLSLLTANAVAGGLSPGEAAALEQRFFAAQRATRTLQAGFTQRVTAPGLPSPAVSQGQLFYRAPDQLRISYSDPAGESMQLDSASFTTVRSGRAPMVRPIDHPSARALAALRDILRGQRPPGEMNVSVTRQGGDYIVVLTPRTAGRFQPERIENIIDARTMQLRSLSLTLPRGTVVRFAFTRLRPDRPLPDGAFTLP
jgi:outer membrane lipoprotein-sorting protein